MRLHALLLLLVACKKSPPPEPRVVLHEQGVENAYPRLSADGTQILYQSNRGGNWQLYILDLATSSSRTLTTKGNNNLPDWSPDGARIAFVSDRDGNEEVYLLEGTTERRLTNNPGRDIHPYFAPDGKSLLFNSERAGQLDVYSLDLTTGESKQLTATKQDETCARYSADASKIVLLRNDPTADDIWLLENGRERNLTNTPQIRDGWPVFGPDNAVYFGAMDKGSFSIYRARSDGTNKQQLTFAGADEEDARPFVSTDGSRLIFNRRHHGGIDILELRLD